MSNKQFKMKITKVKNGFTGLINYCAEEIVPTIPGCAPFCGISSTKQGAIEKLKYQIENYKNPRTLKEILTGRKN